MFDTFFDQIGKELGPLNPDWFEELTAKAFRDKGHHGSSEDENETVKETSALASQLFSTPKIFKQQHCQSPGSIPNEESPNEGNNGDSSAFPWTESSPCLFGSAKDSPKNDRFCEQPRDCLGALETPKRSLARSAKRISESLGAQINPELSWTSSFNTPSSLTPTVILPKTDDRAPSASSIKDKEAIFVRKLFPSFSKASGNTAVLSDTALKQDVIAKSETVQAKSLGEKPVCSPDASLGTSGLWKQKVPSAIEDRDVRCTVQNVLDGAEDVLSIFFSNNASSLRKIKTKERVRRRINNLSRDINSVFLTSEPDENLKADVETESPSKNEDVIQWTPLSLPESILNEGCSSTSLINNHNTVASRETNDSTDLNCTAENNQTFSQTVMLLSTNEAQCQKSLLDKSPAFTLNRKPRKFVYQVPSSDMTKTGVGDKAALPVCLGHMLTEEKNSSDLHQSGFPSEYAVSNQTQQQCVQPLSTEPHDVDHGLDMTQLSKAFAEDFTQEIMSGGPLWSAQSVQPKAEPEQKKQHTTCSYIPNVTDISLNSPNKSAVMLTTFEISRDSGCPTTFSDLDGTTASSADIKEFFPAFKTANNKSISISNEAIMKAKVSLDEAAVDGLIGTINDHMIQSLHKSGSGSCNATRSSVGQSIFPNHASRTCVSDAAHIDGPKSFKMNISDCVSPQSNESDYKTGSKGSITVSDVGPQTVALLKENLGRASYSSKHIHEKLDFKRSAERHTVFNINSSYKPTAVDSSRDDLEENGALTASQKADVTELCNLLEDANSQLDFTQFKPTNLGSDNHTTEREWDPAILHGINFDDSFNCDVKGKHSVRTDASSLNRSEPIQNAAKQCFTSEEARNGIVALTVTEDNSLLDGMKNVLSKFSSNTPLQCFGFKTAKGKTISISERSLNKARQFFEEDNQEAVCNKEVNVDIGEVKPENSKTKPTVDTSDSMCTKNKIGVHTKQDLHLVCRDVNAGRNVMNKQVAANARTGQNCLREKTDVACVDSDSHVGFSTARGAKLKVSEEALLQARKLLNDVDSLESQTHEHALYASGKHDSCISTTNFQKTKAVSWNETSMKINLPGTVMVNQISDGPTITSLNNENAIQEQKSSEGPKEVCTNIFSSETFVPHPGQAHGFQTASGKGVSVSAFALKKAQAMFKDCDSNIDNVKSVNMEGNNDKPDSVQTNVEEAKTISDSDLINNSSLQDQKPPQGEVCHQKGFQSEFSRCPSDLLPLNCGFTTASGKKVSISAEALRKAKNVLSEAVDNFSLTNGSEKTSQVADIHMHATSSGKHKGFCTASGKMVAVSATGLQRAKDLFRECEEENTSSEDLQHQSCRGLNSVSNKPLAEVRVAFPSYSHEHETGSSLEKSIGFSTAGGKRVAISDTALQRAKSLFKDCEEESLTSGSVQPQDCKGFSTPSGKDVTISEKLSLSEVRGFDKTFSCDPKISSGNNLGFSTAGGKKVTVSATALQRAKSLFKDEEEDLAPEELVSEKAPPQDKSLPQSKDIVDGNLKFELNQKNFGFSTASGKGVSVSKVALEEASKLFKDCDTQITATDNPLPSLKNCPQHNDRPAEATSPSKAALSEPAQLDLHSSDLNSCTETQQMYFEQEAMACTKALLADDDLNESVSLMASEDTHYKKSPSLHVLRTQESVDQNRKRKRQLNASSVADASQPPLKRQLLSEFDRTSDSNPSRLTSLKSCPNGTLGDRRVFKYNVHLKPYITGPDRCNSDPKGGMGFLPIQKGVKTGTSNCQDASKVSTGFIPPFNKENKDKNDCSNQMDQKMTTSTSHRDSVAEYCDERSLHENCKPKSITPIDSVPLKIVDSDEKDMNTLREAMQLARDMQNMRLRKKKRQTICPVPGSLYIAKTSADSRINLRDAVGHRCPGEYTQEELHQRGVYHKVLEITSENAESFRFDCNDFFKRELLMESGAVQLADGGWLVPDSNGVLGKEEFYSALCDTPGVDPKLISDAWVFNHYRWIVWKRASMERAFPDLMGNLCLTPEQVLLQLKFRYDVEVDHSQRSALRRIMERDDTPAKTLVLCVCGVAQTCQKPVKDDKPTNTMKESCVIWLTDGWYAIKGLLDPPLSAMLNKGRLRIGDKIVSSGAELVGSQEACPPLEAPESLMLKISANSTRRARWDTKLGYYRDPRPIRLPLSSLYTSGGVVSCVNLVVLRTYPTQWMEKKPNSVFIFRNDRAEDREARKHSNSKHKSMDVLISKIQTQFEKEIEGKKKNRGKRKSFTRHEIESLQDGEDLYGAMERDPAVESHLSERQRETVSKYRRCLEERRQAELRERVQKAVMEAQEAEGVCPSRDVTPVWKLSVTDTNDLQSNCVYTLNIWRPSQDLYGLLREGHKYKVYHLATSEGKKRSGIAQVQLTATKKTVFQDIEVSPEWLHQHFHARECMRFRELQNPHFSSPCGEVDIVGFIVSIVGKQGHCPILHLVDENFDLVSVRTYSSLEQLAVEDLVKTQSLVAISNLQVRPLSGPVPSLYAGEQALFSVNPKEPHLQKALAHLKTFVQNCEQFFSLAEEKLSDVVPSGVSGCFQSPRTPGVPHNLKMNGMVTPQQKSSIFSPFTPLSSRTPASASTSEVKDPKSLKRRRGLDYLSRIPSPPPLTPLKTRASPCVNKTFNPPRRSVTPKPPQEESPRASHRSPGEETWVNDEELAMIDTQALVDGLKDM